MADEHKDGLVHATCPLGGHQIQFMFNYWCLGQRVKFIKWQLALHLLRGNFSLYLYESCHITRLSNALVLALPAHGLNGLVTVRMCVFSCRRHLK